MTKIIKMSLNIVSRSYSKINTNIRSKLYHYFQNTPHFVFMDFEFSSISRTLYFPDVRRITLIKSNYPAVKSMIYANIFPKLSYIRELVHISTPEDKLTQSENLLESITGHFEHTIDYEVAYLDFTNPRHLDIKKISNNFSGFNIGHISNKLYSDCLYEYVTESHSDNSQTLQEIEELQLQRQIVVTENKRYDYADVELR